MTRDSLRQIMGPDFIEFRKSKFSKNSSDDYKYLHVFYNEKDECIAVELFNDCEITVSGTVLSHSASDFNNWLLQLDKTAEISETGATSKKLSIGMSAMGNHIESILFATAGYYQ